MKRNNYGRSDSQSRRNEIITMVSFIGGMIILMSIILYTLIFI
jgi:hypothetical protein